MNINHVIEYLKNYSGKPLKIMEVCGTHTAAIFKAGIRSLISSQIQLISGPGCPVCVTPTAYIDKCIEYAGKKNYRLFTFGDMMKVPGTYNSLSSEKGGDVDVQLMYSPFDALNWARKNPESMTVVAAVGFETTAPVYGLMIQKAAREGVKNIKVLTALKRVIPALDKICSDYNQIDGFLCPGHVSVIIGSKAYYSLADKYKKPFVVSGFEGEHLLTAIYDVVRQCEDNSGTVGNLYPAVVSHDGNKKATALMDSCFESGPAMWRGLGLILNSGLYFKDSYKEYDGGSLGLDMDKYLPENCKCGSVIVGKIPPDECPMFGNGCTPINPYGPCMVSAEGACGIWFRNTARICGGAL